MKKDKLPVNVSVINKNETILSSTIENLRESSFIKDWELSIEGYLNEKNVRVNSLVLGQVGDLADRIYVGANTNKVLIFDLNGVYIDTIELEEGVEVEKLLIIDVTNHAGNELLIQSCDDTVLFYNINHKDGYEEQSYKIRYATSSITALFAIKNGDEFSSIYVGDSDGNIIKNTYKNLKLFKEGQIVISTSEKLSGETVTSISGSNKLLNNNFGLLVGYKNGLLLLLNSNYEVISKFDIDREIENIYLIEKNQSIVITTDDNNIYHFSIINENLVNDWIYYFNGTISTIIQDAEENSQVEFFVLSEDNGTISCFDKNGRFIMTGDPSFEGTTGIFHQQKLILASREGEISQFGIIEQAKSLEYQKLIHDAYKILCEHKVGNPFYEFFNSEFESDENADYFKLFLMTYLSNNADSQVMDKINTLFKNKRYNTDIAEGLIRKIISNSQLKNIFLDKFQATDVSNEIISFQELINKRRSETKLFDRAETFLKKDNFKYIELMSELRIRKLDKIWVNNILEDDPVVGIKYYHDPIDQKAKQLLIATKKGSVLLLNRQTGQIIWRFKLDKEDGTITNIDVADICSDGVHEIILGLENSQNSILIISTNKEKFNSANNEVQLNWVGTSELSYKLYLTRCTVAGMDYEAVHKVKCFDFDYNGVQDLIISSENEKFDVFYFDSVNKARIIPKTKSIDLNDDDVLVFDLVRDNKEQIILYTGSASGNINKHVYNGKDFSATEHSFTERDARITDILHAEIDLEKVVIFSSEDNFIYCLSSDLEYKWAFKTGGDVKSIGTARFNNQDLIFTISDDGYLYALDATGNKKWSYLFMTKDGSACPLDQLLVKDDELIVADSDGSIHMLRLMDTSMIINKMDFDLADSNINLYELLDNPVTSIRIFAVRKLLSTNPDSKSLHKIIQLLNDSNESQELVRCETIKLLTRFLIEKETFNKDYSTALVETLKDYSPEVRIEALKSFLSLIEKHQFNQIDIANRLVEVTKDEDIWVKEYLAGALNKLETTNEELLLAKWGALSSLLKLNKDEEWILNEAANSIGHFLSNISNTELLLTYLNELFENDFEDETYERIRNKIRSPKVSLLFEVYFQIILGDISKIKEACNNFIKIFSDNYQVSIKAFINKINAFINIIDQINLDDIISDQLLQYFSKSLENAPLAFSEIINKLNEYASENNISEKIVSLTFVSDTITTVNQEKSLNGLIDKQIFKLAIVDHLNNLISNASRYLREKVDFEIEIDNKEVIINGDGIADIGFKITNKGYKKIEEIELNVKEDRQSKFEIIENIGEIGELVKSQNKKIFFKIKPKVIDTLDINFDITYKGCQQTITKGRRILIREAIQKEWQVIPNPYTSGIPIENDNIFVGRESLIKEAIAAIQQHPVFVMGHRRMGKTSLIKYIQRHFLKSEEYVSVFVSAEKVVFSSMNDFLFSFCRPIAEELFRKQIITKDQYKEYLAAIRKNGLIDFGVFFDDILFEFSMMDKILILIIDEYPIIHEAVDEGKIDSQFISNLRGYMQNNSKEFKMIYSGASSLKYLKSQYSSNIMGVGKSLEVSFLDEQDIKTLISKPLNDQLQFENSAFQYLMEITHGQPFLVQVCLSYLVDKLNKEKKGSIVFKEALQEGINYFLDQAPHLQDDWNKDVYSSSLKWGENEEKIARSYKQLIITLITDTWKKTKNGLKKEEILSILEKSLADFHKLNRPIFEEVINIIAGSDDILKQENELYFIKVGLFREWVINKMNLSYNTTLTDLKKFITD